MKCPFCDHDVPALWQELYALTDSDGKAHDLPSSDITVQLPIRETKNGDVIEMATTAMLRWMKCPNDQCSQLLVLVGQASHHLGIPPSNAHFKYWYAIPRNPSPRRIDQSVPDPFRRNYIEAASILADSPRMSSVLSRRILADLLEKYAGRLERNLESRIEKFLEDQSYPARVKENLHHLREIGNFGAHTQTDQDTGQIIEVERDEAEWTLEVVDGLFEYFIVQPVRDLARRTKFDAKIAAAGRKPIKKR
jgi:hypothetical protein